MVALPPDLSFGYITGQFLKVVADTSDLDRFPDGEPWVGLEVTFKAGPSKLLSKSNKKFFLPQPIVCSTDANGYLIDAQGNQGVYLVATDQDSVKLNPVDFTYTVTVKNKFTTLDEFSFSVPSDSTQDLADLAPVPTSVGTAITRGLQGERGIQGPVGPSGGPFPNLTGIEPGQIPITTGNGGVTWYSVDVANLMGVF